MVLNFTILHSKLTKPLGNKKAPVKTGANIIYLKLF